MTTNEAAPDFISRVHAGNRLLSLLSFPTTKCAVWMAGASARRVSVGLGIHSFEPLIQKPTVSWIARVTEAHTLSNRTNLRLASISV